MFRSPRSLLPLLALVGVAFSLGTGHVCARLALTHGVTILTAATSRSVCAAALLFALLRLRGIPLLPLKGTADVTVLFGLLIAAQTLALQLAVKRMPVALAILLFYTYPLFTGIASSMLGGERLSPRLVTALFAAFGGLALVLGVAVHGIDPLGVAAALVASACFTAVLVLTPKLAPTLPAPVRTLLMLTTAALLFLVASLVLRQFHWPPDNAGAAGLIGLAVFYAVGIIVLFLVLPLLGPTQTAVVLNLEPVAVALVAWGMVGEVLTATQSLGAAIVVAAVITFQVTARRK
jgi:drug/metabolite transporter (DMT)-like permease